MLIQIPGDSNVSNKKSRTKAELDQLTFGSGHGQNKIWLEIQITVFPVESAWKVQGDS